MLNRMRLWVRSILPRRLEQEMQEEMAEHLERAMARLMTRGLSAEEARRAATREFGNVAFLQEEARDARGGRWLETLARDVRFALRHFGRKPGMTMTIVAVLTIGMSISTVLFSFVHSYSVQPPPGIPRGDDLVRIRASQRSTEGSGVRQLSLDELREYQRLTDYFSDIAGWANGGVVIGGDGERPALSTTASFVTDSYFAVLGVRPMLGAGLPSAASVGEAMAPVAVISHDAWDLLFGKSPSAIGATLTVDGIAVTVVGVAPPRFRGVDLDSYNRFKLWLPLSNRPLWVQDAEGEAEVFRATARLRPGVRLSAATAAVKVIASRAAASVDQPSERALERQPTADVVPLLIANADPNFERQVREMAIAFAVLGLLVLLVTCTNVSALIAGLAIARRREIGIRLSMGASRTRVIRQLLTESVLLAVASGPLALAVVGIINRVVAAYIPNLPLAITVSWPATAFTFGVALTAGTLFGLSPALHATRVTVASALSDSSTKIASPARLQRGTVVAQIAFTQPLIVGVAAVLLNLLSNYQRQGLSESTDRIVSLKLRPAATSPVVQRQGFERARRREEMQRVRHRLTSTPGVTSVVEESGYTVELDGYSVHPEDRIEGGLQKALRIDAPVVTPGYFATLGIRLLRGREFAPTDAGFSEERNAAEVPVVIGDDVARRLWPGADPIGRRLQPGVASPRRWPTLSVVGVVDQPMEEETDGLRVYLPLDSARAGSSRVMLIRTTREANALIPTIRTVVQTELPGVAIVDIRTVSDIEAEQRFYFHVAFWMLAGGGLLALCLSAIGLYAVIAFAVGQRTAEIAVRVAVGARARHIVGRFIGDGLRLSALGLVLGLPLSLAALRVLLANDFLEALPLAPIAAGTAVGVLAVSIVATWKPARRAASVDPGIVLRGE